MPLRLLVVIAEFVVAGSVTGWGVAVTVRPQWWASRGARWWVGWTHEPVSRMHGVAVALVGVGLLVGAVAAAATAPAVAIPALVRDLQPSGLGVVLLGGVLLAATHPAPAGAATTRPDPVVPEPPAVAPATAAAPPPLTAAI